MSNLQTLELSSFPPEGKQEPEMFASSSNEAFTERRKKPRKTLEMSDLSSNLLLFFSITVAIAPFLLGDNLSLFVANLTRDCLIGLNQFGDYLVGLLS